ncbi:hypothetical protein Cni_G01565 [Canna indica]|uniref:Uncharacterized protein n=1 Tax=Canna indica TaxID=4628 RepID=A0AAQ3PYV2_9LILI|nr:hypothetical protein Cni_G01565 [Canna indica]
MTKVQKIKNLYDQICTWMVRQPSRSSSNTMARLLHGSRRQRRSARRRRRHAASVEWQLMACSTLAAGSCGPTTLALIAATTQTGDHIACVVPGPDELRSSLDALSVEPSIASSSSSATLSSPVYP